MPCVTHHYACACREAEYADAIEAVRAENARLRLELDTATAVLRWLADDDAGGEWEDDIFEHDWRSWSYSAWAHAALRAMGGE